MWVINNLFVHVRRMPVLSDRGVLEIRQGAGKSSKRHGDLIVRSSPEKSYLDNASGQSEYLYDIFS